MDDVAAMARALTLGERGRLTSAPNPWVGCLIVRDELVVGEGYHHRAGEPHAEGHALGQAAERARGATAYVTLEPCVHHGRTPPCVDALVRAGVSRVVVAVLDPDPRVAGRGVMSLRAAGIRVDVGICAGEATASLAPYLHQRRTGRAYGVLKAAVSIDGRTAATDGSARWITGVTARADTHRLRAESQAVIVGAGTALIDHPSLTARDVDPTPEPQPLRVLLDAHGRVPPSGPLFDTALARTLVITTARADAPHVAAWRRAGADVAVVPATVGGVDLCASLELLGSRGVLQALIEGGPTLFGSFVRAQLVERLVVYVGARTLSQSGRPLLAGPGAETIAEAGRWQLLDVHRLGDDVRLDYAPRTRPAEAAA